jgi:hypothetical protein
MKVIRVCLRQLTLRCLLKTKQNKTKRSNAFTYLSSVVIRTQAPELFPALRHALRGVEAGVGVTWVNKAFLLEIMVLTQRTREAELARARKFPSRRHLARALVPAGVGSARVKGHGAITYLAVGAGKARSARAVEVIAVRRARAVVLARAGLARVGEIRDAGHAARAVKASRAAALVPVVCRHARPAVPTQVEGARVRIVREVDVTARACQTFSACADYVLTYHVTRGSVTAGGWVAWIDLYRDRGRHFAQQSAIAVRAVTRHLQAVRHARSVVVTRVGGARLHAVGEVGQDVAQDSGDALRTGAPDLSRLKSARAPVLARVGRARVGRARFGASDVTYLSRKAFSAVAGGRETHRDARAGVLARVGQAGVDEAGFDVFDLAELSRITFTAAAERLAGLGHAGALVEARVGVAGACRSIFSPLAELAREAHQTHTAHLASFVQTEGAVLTGGRVARLAGFGGDRFGSRHVTSLWWDGGYHFFLNHLITMHSSESLGARAGNLHRVFIHVARASVLTRVHIGGADGGQGC